MLNFSSNAAESLSLEREKQRLKEPGTDHDCVLPVREPSLGAEPGIHKQRSGVTPEALRIVYSPS